jgi:hypothetical protein
MKTARNWLAKLIAHRDLRLLFQNAEGTGSFVKLNADMESVVSQLASKGIEASSVRRVHTHEKEHLLISSHFGISFEENERKDRSRYWSFAFHVAKTTLFTAIFEQPPLYAETLAPTAKRFKQL